jgi:hypothetical protein
MRNKCVANSPDGERSGRPFVGKVLQMEARLAGFEPAAHGLEVRCSIQLSYRRTSLATALAGGWERAGDGIRTRDNQLGRLELYQLSYTRLLEPVAPPDRGRDERI